MWICIYRPSFPVESVARHAPHFAPGVNCTDRHGSRQAPVGGHKCETGSKLMFVGSAARRRSAEVSDVPKGIGDGHGAGLGSRHITVTMRLLTAAALVIPAERQVIQGSSKPTWRTINLSHNIRDADLFTSKRNAWIWTVNDQWSSSWTAQGTIPDLLGPASTATSCSGTLEG